MPHQKNEPKKPTGSPIIAGVDRDEVAKAPYGMCPVISGCQAVVVPSHAGMRPPLVAAPQVINVNMEVPCMGPRCHWWIPEWESCCVRGIAKLPEIAAVIKPASWKENLEPSRQTPLSVEVYLNEKINNLVTEIEGLHDRLLEIEVTEKEPTK